MGRDHFEEAEDIADEEKTEEQIAIENELVEKKRNFIACFDTHPGKEVLKHISHYCRLDESTYADDPIKLAYLNGVRDAGLFITNMAKLDNSSKPTEKEETDE